MSEQSKTENPNLLLSIRRHSTILASFAVLVALAVGLVFGATSDEILFQQAQAERAALAQVMPGELHDNDLLEDPLPLGPDAVWEEVPLLGLRTERNGYVARRGDTVSGVILPVLVRDGYSGDISLLVGILPDGSLSGVRVTSHRETPGLGDKIDLRIDNWILGFEGRSLNSPPESRWAVRRDGGDFDQFVGATITPRAVVNGVKKALLFFHHNQDALLSQ